MRPLSRREYEQFNRDVNELVHKWALRIRGSDPAYWYNLASPLMHRSRDDRLAVLAAWAHLARHTQHVQKTAVEEAAYAGADYAEIGAAVLMSRQGARQKWPGLADRAAEARDRDLRAGRTRTPTVYILWHIDDQWRLTPAGSVLTTATKYDGRHDASDIDDAKHWAEDQLTKRGLAITKWRGPFDETDKIAPRSWAVDVKPASVIGANTETGGASPTTTATSTGPHS